MLIPLYEGEAESNKVKIDRLIRRTFKKFALLKKNVCNAVVSRIMHFDFAERAHEVSVITKEKWNARKKNLAPHLGDPGPRAMKTRSLRSFVPVNSNCS